MQNFDNGKLVFSASDLANASECLWAQVRRIDKALGFDIEVPKDDDAMLERAGQLGNIHEAKKLEEFRSQFGEGVAEIPRPDYDDKSKTHEQKMLELSAFTLDALKAKKNVVFQATFFDGEFQGFADFLVLTDSGEYAVYDTKLARKAKITALIQLAAYAHQLQLNGIPTSSQVHLILGDQSVSTHNLEDILPTYLRRRRTMSELIELRRKNRDSGGSPVEWGDDLFSACGRCAVCEPEAEKFDDLVGVAGMRLEQRAKLVAAGIRTLEDLAATEVFDVPDLHRKTFEKLRAQARLQLKTRKSGPKAKPETDYLDVGALAALPKMSDGDIFFDFEGDPLYQEGNIWNLDYLFGYVDSKSEFFPIWAHNLEQEKLAFIEFISRLKERLAKYPDMHIYHYAPYEKVHLLSLADRHGVGGEFVDDLLRGFKLVDLYPIVRKALLVGSPSYSLKKLEPLFMGEEERKGVANAADSVVEYANYCDLVARNESKLAAEKLADIEQYNAYDCRATLALRNFLLEKADEEGIEPVGASLKEPKAPEEPNPLFEELMGLIDDVPLSARDADQTAVALVAAAIEFHRRESKIMYREYFNRLEAPIEDWQDNRDVCVIDRMTVLEDWNVPAGKRTLQRELLIETTPAPGSRIKAKEAYEFLYPSDSTALPEGASPVQRRISKVTVKERLDDSTFIVTETIGKATQHNLVPDAMAPGVRDDANKIKSAIRRVAEGVARAYPSWERNPALDILRRVSPLEHRMTTLDAGETYEVISATIQQIESSYLAVQGPPGSGKSYNGGQVIADLVMNHGWKVGVTAQSHPTVENLLRSIAKAGVPTHLIGKKVQGKTPISEVANLPDTTWTPIDADGYARFVEGKDAYVIGGTSWDFTHEDRVPYGSLDLLVIDEAGQFSLANTIAVSVSANRLLLLGDPQQLPQVTQGTHPEPIDGSALGWLAGDDEVLSPDFGYFLPSSYRMNNEVCSVVSANWYDSKLKSSANTRMLEGVEPGFFPIPVSHTGNSTSSEEEADAVVNLVRDVITKTWTEDGESKVLADAKENVIVVAPYNAQVQLIRKKLDAAGFSDIPVGTVDKFQGQEAAIAIVSMSSSSAVEVPRGIEFLFMPNRLNVAISRAKWAAYLLYSPELLDYRPTNVDNLRLLSKFIGLVEQGNAS
jgi:uncharacterized protein